MQNQIDKKEIEKIKKMIKNIHNDSISDIDEIIKIISVVSPRFFSEQTFNLELFNHEVQSYLSNSKESVNDDIYTNLDEKYGLNWMGKQKSIALSQSSSLNTIKENKSKSFYSGNVKNMIIEGDNLDVLKILKKHITQK